MKIELRPGCEAKEKMNMWDTHFTCHFLHFPFYFLPFTHKNTSSYETHKKLNAWLRSYELVKVLYNITSTFPVEERFGLVSQIRRAGVSIPVNIAEGASRRGKKEFIHFLHISLGSLTELDTLISLSRDLKFVPEEGAVLVINELEIIGKLIYGLIKKLEQEV